MSKQRPGGIAKRLTRVAVGMALACGALLGLQDPASAQPLLITHANSVGAVNGGTTPGAAWDGYYQVYAFADSGNCAILQAYLAGDWTWAAVDCIHDEDGVTTLLHSGTSVLIVRLCQAGATPTCSSTRYAYDDGT